MSQAGNYSNLALYSTMAVLVFAFIAYAVDLARVSAAPESAAERRPMAGSANALMWLATALAAVTVVLRGIATERAPMGNMYEFTTVAAAFTLAVYVLWGLRRDLRWLGVFVAGLVLLMLGLALAVFTPPADLVPSLKDYWLVIHVTVATLSVAVFGVGFLFVVLYLLRRRRGPDAPDTGIWAVLPSSQRLEHLAYSAHVIAFPLWTFTVIAGAIWAQKAWGAYWNWDPKEVWSFVIWVVYAAYLHARATAGWGRRWAPWLAVAGFAALIANFVIVNYFLTGMHSYA